MTFALHPTSVLSAVQIHINRSIQISGNAEWESGPRGKILRIILKAPQVLANEIYAWASQNLLLGTVATVFELHAGEDRSTG